jgi:4-amino-4-deoxy-L-arabinose transferase-like glycosyltransferase
MRRQGRHLEWAAVGAITVLAAVLRLWHLGRVSPDPFYDAAVRSMTLSWHNFFFGAFEPSGSVSIDKPPVDLWLQVASVKAFGFSSTTLKLPEAFAGIAAVPMLYAAVRRLWSVPAGLAAALALAVLPVEVITSRSDTMDGVMMALLVLALLFIVRALETGSTLWLLAAAAALGVAFNVKLLESVVAVPGLALLAFMGLGGTVRHRVAQIAGASAVYVAVALLWLTATLLFPASERPWAIGSTNGSAWNAAFVFNGTDRLGSTSPEPSVTVYIPGHHYRQATQSERDRIPIVPASPTRLLARIGPLSGERLGLELLLALLLGVPALIWGLRAANEPDPERASALAAAGAGPPAPDDPGSGRRPRRHPTRMSAADRTRMRRAMAAGLGLWLLMGIVLFSHMARLHPRYVEGFTPAVAAVLGIGAAWAASPRGRAQLIVLLVALLASVYYAERLLYGTPVEWWFVLVGAIGAGVLAALARTSLLGVRARALAAPAGVMVMMVVCFSAVPLATDSTSIETHVTDAGYVGALPSEEQRLLSDYVRANARGAKYELAAESATQIGSLIVQDARPILVLTTYAGRVFTTVPELKRLIAQGKVRYALLGSSCHHGAVTVVEGNPACSVPAVWIREHGTDVSHAAGLKHSGVLWLLPGAAP